MRRRLLILLVAAVLATGCQMLPWTSLDSSDPSVHRNAMEQHYKSGSSADRFHSW